MVVVATSNVAPSELYQDGLNRAPFLPFIALIEEHMEVVQLNARADFRLEKLGGAPVWYVPADRAAESALDEAWRRLTAGHAASAEAEPDALYDANEGFEAHEFKRTASRLIEMRSDAYLALPHGQAAASGSTAGLVET